MFLCNHLGCIPCSFLSASYHEKQLQDQAVRLSTCFLDQASQFRAMQLLVLMHTLGPQAATGCVFLGWLNRFRSPNGAIFSNMDFLSSSVWLDQHLSCMFSPIHTVSSIRNRTFTRPATWGSSPFLKVLRQTRREAQEQDVVRLAGHFGVQSGWQWLSSIC